MSGQDRALDGARALVSGATGLIGSALVKHLSSLGAEVIALVRSASAGRLDGEAVAQRIEVDSYAPDVVRSALTGLKVDVVFHLGAYGIKPNERDPLQLAEGNVVVTLAMLSALANKPPRRFVFAGSSSEYAPGVEPTPIDETHAIAPTSLYGAAKAAAHLCGCTLARELGIDFVTLRPFGVFGPGEAPHRFVPYLARALARGDSPILTAGEQARDWIYADDAADAFATAAGAALEPYSAYNVCTGRPMRVRDVARMVAEEMGVEEAALGLGAKPYRPDEPFWVVGNPTRFSQATGWSARVELREGVRRTVRWALSEAPE